MALCHHVTHVACGDGVLRVTACPSAIVSVVPGDGLRVEVLHADDAGGPPTCHLLHARRRSGAPVQVRFSHLDEEGRSSRVDWRGTWP